jgi:hypothetical protein
MNSVCDLLGLGRKVEKVAAISGVSAKIPLGKPVAGQTVTSIEASPFFNAERKTLATSIDFEEWVEEREREEQLRDERFVERFLAGRLKQRDR